MRNVVKATQTDAVGINTRVGMLDWTSVSTHLDDHGWAMVEKLLDGVAREIEEYFAGRRRTFDVPLDLRLSHGFRRTILSHLPEIGYGKTTSYAAIAKAAGHPKAVRAAGSACASNPLPVVVPCHRVVRSDGTIGQYIGGVDAKRALLTLEEAA